MIRSEKQKPAMPFPSSPAYSPQTTEFSMKATHQTNKHPMYPVLNNKKTALSGAKSFFIALVAMMILSLTASAELITYSWLRMDLYKSPGTDRSGLGHRSGVLRSIHCCRNHVVRSGCNPGRAVRPHPLPVGSELLQDRN